jgi:hypothetical protein
MSDGWSHEHAEEEHALTERESETRALNGGDPARLAATVGNRAFGAMIGRVGEASCRTERRTPTSRR